MHKSMLPIELNERVTIKRGGLSMPTFGVFVDGERIGTIRKRAGGSMSEASNRRKKRQFASGGRTVVLARPPGGGTSSIAGNGVGRASRTSPVMHTVPGNQWYGYEGTFTGSFSSVTPLTTKRDEAALALADALVLA